MASLNPSARTFLPFAALLVFAAQLTGPAALAGIFVGHPTTELTGPNGPSEVLSAQMTIDKVVHEPCSGTDSIRQVDETFDLYADETLTLNTGTWCGVDLDLTGEVEVEIDQPNGSVTLYADVGFIPLDLPGSSIDVSASGDDAVLQLVSHAQLEDVIDLVDQGQNAQAEDELEDAILDHAKIIVL